MTKKFIILSGRYRFFSSLSFYHGLDMFLATRDALVINGSYPGFFTSSGGYSLVFRGLSHKFPEILFPFFQ